MSTPTYNLLHTRVRYDLDGLNSEASGWIAAEDADNFDVDWGKVFRIRVRISETNDKGGNQNFKLQYNKNTTGWTDIYPSNSGTNVNAVASVLSSQYADGDSITTQYLTSGGGTFINGAGDELDNSANSTIDNEETELEFALMFMNFYDGPSQNSDGDSFEFRVTEVDGTTFTGTENTVTITLNTVDYYIGGTPVESPNRIGPIADSNGNLYAIMEPAQSDPDMIMIKSTDGGKSWAEVDGANRPTTTDLECVDIFQDGTTLHILQQGGASDDVDYHTFRTSDDGSNPDTWGTTDESVRAAANVTDQACGIVKRSDGTIVAVYRYNDGTNERVGYKIRNGTWGSENNVDATASVNFNFCGVVLGAGDKTHIFYKDSTNDVVYHKSLSSADSLSGRDSVENDPHTGGDSWSTTPPVYWDNAGTEEIMILVWDNSDQLLYSVVISDDGTPDARKTVSDNTVYEDPTGLQSEQPVADLVVDSDADTVYTLYSDATSHDLYRDSAVNDGGWGTDTEQLDAKEIELVRGSVFTHSSGNGGEKVYGFIYDNGSAGGVGYQWYDEYTIALIDLSISVSDSVSVTDTPTVSGLEAGDLSISESDAVATADTPTMYLGVEVVESDAISVADTLPPIYHDNIIVSEDVSVSVITPVVDLEINESDAVSVTDSPTTGPVSDPGVSESEAITATDSPTMYLGVEVSESEAITVGDTATLDPVADTSISESDAITVTDIATMYLGVEISESDAITIVDTATLDPVTETNISESEAITVVDTASLTSDLGNISESESITVVDSPTVSVVDVTDLAVSESDAVSVIDTATFAPVSETNISESDAVGVVDTATLDPVADTNISESDAVTVADTATVFMSVEVSESEAVTVSDNATLDPVTETNITESEAVSVTDTATLANDLAGIDESESVTIADTATIANALAGISESESITVGDVDTVTITDAGTLAINRSDSITVADTSTLENDLTDISESDSIVVVDTPTVNPPTVGDLSINVSDSVSVSDTASTGVYFPVFARPSSDVSTGSWTPSAGGDLYAVIDEVTPNDADYIETTTDADVATVALSALVDPQTGANHTMRFRARSVSGGGDEKARLILVEGATIRALLEVDITASWQTFSYTLTTTQANSIVDYTNLRLRFVSLNITGGESVQVSWAELELPMRLDISESEAISVTDSPTVGIVAIPAANISESESISIVDSATLGAVTETNISESESVTVADTASLDALLLDVSESEAITVGEATSVSVVAVSDLTVSESDAVSVADSASLITSDLQVSESDAVSVGEASNVSVVSIFDLSISESDAVSVADTPSLIDSDPQVSESDAVTVGEVSSVSVVAISDLAVSESDAVSVADAASLSIGDLAVSETDAITVVDVAGLELLIDVSESEAVSVADSASITALVMAGISVSDSITVSDTASVVNPDAVVYGISTQGQPGRTRFDKRNRDGMPRADYNRRARRRR